jgi:hypothetical protein
MFDRKDRITDDFDTPRQFAILRAMIEAMPA